LVILNGIAKFKNIIFFVSDAENQAIIGI